MTTHYARAIALGELEVLQEELEHAIEARRQAVNALDAAALREWECDERVRKAQLALMRARSPRATH